MLIGSLIRAQQFCVWNGAVGSLDCRQILIIAKIVTGARKERDVYKRQTFGCSCLHGLRRADLQGSEEETQQKVVGRHRGCGICGCDSGGHSDCPDTDAALTGYPG